MDKYKQYRKGYKIYKSKGGKFKFKFYVLLCKEFGIY